mgnify:CR=1 FL=1
MENITQKLDKYMIDVDVNDAVSNLTEGQRFLLRIKNEYGFAAKVIADITNKSCHTVNQQFKYIREKFNGASIDEALAMIRKAGITLMLVCSLFGGRGMGRRYSRYNRRCKDEIEIVASFDFQIAQG